MRAKNRELGKRIPAIRKEYVHLEDVVGAYEGAGYSSEGLYRPMMECIMFSNREKAFCKVCEKAIIDMIEYFTQ